MDYNYVKVYGQCAECGCTITDEDECAYVDSEGRYFDSIECLLEFYDIEKVVF